MPLGYEPRFGNIKESLERVNLGNHKYDFGLQTWSLIGPDIAQSDYSLLDASLKKGRCEIQETAREAVDSVVVINRSAESIFALHGQLLRGAKQNRAINLTTMFLRIGDHHSCRLRRAG